MTPACAILLDPRILLEIAAEIDPDTYIPILDLLDEDQFDLECSDTEPDCDEDEGHPGGVQVYEHCPCCGSVTNNTRLDIA